MFQSLLDCIGKSSYIKTLSFLQNLEQNVKIKAFMDNQLPKQKTSNCVYIRIVVQMSKSFYYEGSWGGQTAATRDPPDASAVGLGQGLRAGSRDIPTANHQQPPSLSHWIKRRKSQGQKLSLRYPMVEAKILP